MGVETWFWTLSAHRDTLRCNVTRYSISSFVVWGIHKPSWLATRGLAKCQKQNISLCSKLVKEGGGGGGKKPSKFSHRSLWIPPIGLSGCPFHSKQERAGWRNELTKSHTELWLHRTKPISINVRRNIREALYRKSSRPIVK